MMSKQIIKTKSYFIIFYVLFLLQYIFVFNIELKLINAFYLRLHVYFNSFVVMIEIRIVKYSYKFQQ